MSRPFARPWIGLCMYVHVTYEKHRLYGAEWFATNKRLQNGGLDVRSLAN